MSYKITGRCSQVCIPHRLTRVPPVYTFLPPIVKIFIACNLIYFTESPRSTLECILWFHESHFFAYANSHRILSVVTLFLHCFKSLIFKKRKKGSIFHNTIMILERQLVSAGIKSASVI